MPKSKPKCKHCREDKQKCEPGSSGQTQPCKRCEGKGLPCSEFHLTLRAQGAQGPQRSNAQVDMGGPTRYQDLPLETFWLQRLKLYVKSAIAIHQERCNIFDLHKVDISLPLYDTLRQVAKHTELVLSKIKPSLTLPSLTDSLSFLLDSPVSIYLQLLQEDSTGLNGQQSRILVAMRAGEKAEWKEDELPRYLEGYRNAMHHLTTIADCAVPKIPPLHNLLLLGEDKLEMSWMLSEFQAIEERDLFDRSLLHLALDLGIGDDAIHLLSTPVSTRDVDIWSRHPLHIASSTGSINTAIRLIGSNTNLELKDCDGLRALHYASAAGHEDIVRLLVDEAEIDPPDEIGRTPLSHGARNGHTAGVNLLVEKGANIDSRDKWGRTPLSHGARNGHTAVVSLLLKKGANIDSRDDDGFTPLSYGARNGHTTVVSLLLEKGSNIESQDDDGWTPLSHAIDSGRMAVVELLLKNGASARRLFEARRYIMADFRERHLGILKLLLKPGIFAEDDPLSMQKLISACGEAALSYASELGELEVVVKLLEAKLDPNLMARRHEPALCYAVRAGNTEIVEILLAHGANPDLSIAEGRTAISIAAEQGNDSLVQKLRDARQFYI